MNITREEELALIDPASYHRHGYPWATWAKLRKEDPIHFVERENAESFWAVTRYNNIVEIERNTEVFKNEPRLIMDSVSQPGIRLIVNMDPPDHTLHRTVANRHFLPGNIKWVKKYAEEIVTEAFDKIMERNGEVIDFQADVANLVPTAVISAYLGAPRELWPRIVEWTNQIINSNDPRISKGREQLAVTGQAHAEMYKAYAPIFEDRKQRPQDDLMTALVQARINDRPLTDPELFAWAMILTTAGHETTQGTFGAAVHALLRHPDEYAKLRANPELVPQAIDEFLRYVSPAVHFVRTPDRDVEICGKKIRAGDRMVMFYPSANRDAEIFDNPERLDIERSPNRHLAFGIGIHQCLGMHLARLELKIMVEHFLQRVEKIEVAGEPENVFTVAVGGYKHFPVRMTVRPKA